MSNTNNIVQVINTKKEMKEINLSANNPYINNNNNKPSDREKLVKELLTQFSKKGK